MPAQDLKEFLDHEQVNYTTIQHSRAYTANTTAAISHIPQKELAKTVIVKIDGEMAMAVLPASQMVHLARLKRAVGAEDVVLAPEAEFDREFPDCEIGAMPPFGNLYNMKVFVEEGLTVDEDIAFNAGSHTELVRMTYKDFANLVKPLVVKF